MQMRAFIQQRAFLSAGLIVLVCAPHAWAQSGPALSVCDGTTKAPYCAGVRGDRAEGWLPQSRSEVMARHGMVATSQPLAAEAGLRILQRGGNAIDAAVATAATLSVVEPMMTGPGGDLFALIYIAKEHKLYALNASGMAPSGATLEHFASLGYHADPNNWGPGSGMPARGILPVTVPGSVWGWDEVLRRFGTLHFREVLAPALDYAQHGFPLSERIANDWRLPDSMPPSACCTSADPDSVAAWYLDGKPPRAGQIMRNPGLARTFRLLQKYGRDAFYKGEIAQAIVAKSDRLGGTMTLQDLASYRGEWNEPAVSHYRGTELYELPPPSQDWAANEMLNILEACVPGWAPGESLASLGPTHPLYWHLLIEAKKLAYADLIAYNADPHFATVPLARLLSPQYAKSLCSKVDPRRASTPGRRGAADGTGDTIVLATADAQGNMVSWVNSNFAEWGSGLTVPGYGIVLHDRGALFTLDPHSPNAIAPHKRPYNTLAAGFVMRAGQPLMTLTLMGGDMQAQGHAQALVSILDLGANLQAAADLARFRHSQITNTLGLESGLYQLVGAQLAAMGHRVVSIDGTSVGGFQSILFTPDASGAAGDGGAPGGWYRGGSDFRKDGQAIGW
ncbi:MAG TPA: gamma-glutamyltransferase family protein [Steroidobacteraceae bacterium]|nr:gamma-glutamyltransferase family protein [Steroidobacteraceae bacterium]